MSISTNSVTAYGLTTYFELSWSETISVNNNTSTLAFTLTTRQSPSGSGYQRTINASGSTVVINGTSYAISATKAYDGLVIWSTSGIVIEHNNDGTKAINASVKVNVGGDYVSGSGTIQLATIQRSSVVSVSPSLLTSGNATVTITPYVSTYTHTVSYTVNDTTTTLGTKTTTKIFTIAYDTLKAIIGEYRSADVSVKCITYNGSIELGTSYASFTVQTGKIPFSLYDDKNGNIGVTIGEQATGAGFNVLTDDIHLKPLDLVPNGVAAKCGYQIDGKDVYRKMFTSTGDIVSGTPLKIAHGITSYEDIWIDMSLSHMTYASKNLRYPLVMTGYNGNFSSGNQIQVAINGTNIELTTNDTYGWKSWWKKVIVVMYY